MRNKTYSWAMLFIFMFAMVIPLASFTAPAAAAYTEAGIISQMAEVYQNMSDADKAAVRAARTKLSDPNALTEEQWNTVIGDLLTPKVIERFNTQDEAKDALKAFCTNLGTVYYSTDEVTLKNSIDQFKIDNGTSFDTLFDGAVDTDDLLQLLSDTRAELPNAITENPADVLRAASSNAALAEVGTNYLITAVRVALNKQENHDLAEQIETIGWTAEMLVNQEAALADILDSSSTYALQKAFALATIRSKIEVTPNPTTVYVGTTLTYSISLLGRDTVMNIPLADLVTWKSSNSSVVTNDLLAVNAGTATLQARPIGRDESDYIAEVTVTVTIQSSGGGVGSSSGGGGGGNPNPPSTGDTTTIGSDQTQTQTTVVNGQKVETITLKSTAKAEIAKAAAAGQKSIEFEVGTSATSKTVFTIPSDIVKTAKGMNVQISTPNAQIEVPKALMEALAAANLPLTMEVSRGDATEVKGQMTGVADLKGATVLGTPTVIKTALKGNTKVTLPLAGITIPTNAADRQAFLNSLAIFVVHSDGTKEVVKATIENDANGNPVSIGFTVDKFSTFAIVKLSSMTSIKDIVGHWAQPSIEQLVEAGAIIGYPDGSFKPDNTITRAEFATVLVKAYKLPATSGTTFSDTANHWAKGYIATAAANGIIHGYSATQFGPNDLITREQMAAMIVRAEKLATSTAAVSFTDKAGISSWAVDAVKTAVAQSIITGYPDNTFKPQGNASRAEAVTVIVKALK